MAVDFKTFGKVVKYVTAVHKPVLLRGRHGIGKSTVVYQYAKLRMLAFFYDVVDTFLERSDYCLIEMDTDSLYMALSGGSFEALVNDAGAQQSQRALLRR